MKETCVTFFLFLYIEESIRVSFWSFKALFVSSVSSAYLISTATRKVGSGLVVMLSGFAGAVEGETKEECYHEEEEDGPYSSVHTHFRGC